MKILIVKNDKEMSKRASKLVIDDLNLNSSMTMGFATGSTPLGLYNSLVKSGEDFSKVVTFNLDEYYPISSENKQSYSFFMCKNLFDEVKFKENNLLNGAAKNARKECKEYEQKIFEKGIDIQILGIGGNGHIGFNEPGSSFNSKTRVVKLKKETVEDNSRFFDSEKEVPKKAMTMGIDTIMHSKKIILLAIGEGKAEAIKDMIEGPFTKKCPASVLQKHPDVTVILDMEAASLLDKMKEPTYMRGYKIITEKNIPRDKKIVVISPHPDDSAIGPGGAIAKLAGFNKVYTFVMTSGHRAFIPDTTEAERIKIREKEVIEESKILGTIPVFLKMKFYDSRKVSEEDLQKLKSKLEKIRPDIVLLPQKDDVHMTHQLSREACLKVLKDVQVWSYEGPWALFDSGDFNTIMPYSESFLDLQKKAIKKHISQMDRTDYVTAAESIAKLRGALIPEQELIGFGKKPIKLEKNIELFNVERL